MNKVQQNTETDKKITFFTSHTHIRWNQSDWICVYFASKIWLLYSKSNKNHTTVKTVQKCNSESAKPSYKMCLLC